MAEQNASEEVDLGYMFSKVKESYNDSLVYLYRKIKGNWIALIAVIIIGIIAGFILNSLKKEVKETSLIVQINFDSTNYIYNAIDQLNKKIEQNDTLFLVNQGLYNDNPLIVSAEIEPIVNILDIIENTQTTNSAYLKTVFDESKFEDDMLTSEMFIPQYKYHRITLLSNKANTDEIVDYFLKYLNNNDLLNKIKKVKVDNTKLIIERNKQSISYIDSIVKVYGTLIENPVTTGQNYYSSYEVNNGNIHLLFEGKADLLEKNQELEIELEKYDNIIELINTPEFEVRKEFSNVLLIPILLLLIYIVVAFLVGLYKRAKNLSNSRVEMTNNYSDKTK